MLLLDLTYKQTYNLFWEPLVVFLFRFLGDTVHKEWHKMCRHMHNATTKREKKKQKTEDKEWGSKKLTSRIQGENNIITEILTPVWWGCPTLTITHVLCFLPSKHKYLSSL